MIDYINFYEAMPATWPDNYVSFPEHQCARCVVCHRSLYKSEFYNCHLCLFRVHTRCARGHRCADCVVGDD